MVFATHGQRAARPNSAREPGTVRKMLKIRQTRSQDDSGWLRMDSGWLRTAQDGLRMGQKQLRMAQDGSGWHGVCSGRLRMAQDSVRYSRPARSTPEQRAGARNCEKSAGNTPDEVPGRLRMTQNGLRMAQDGLRLAQDGLRMPLAGPGANRDEPRTAHSITHFPCAWQLPTVVLPRPEPSWVHPEPS